MLLQSGLVAALLPVCCFAPGFYFVRGFGWNPLEKLCGSVGLSLILLYLVSWATYCLSPAADSIQVYTAVFVAVSLVCVVAAAVCRKDIGRLARTPSVRRGLAGFVFLLVWTALQMAMIRNYSGAGWGGDWLEHFQRTLFFLRHFPARTVLLGGYELPARPPLMNVLAALFMPSDRFELFQLVFVFLNLLLFLPCYLIMPALGWGARRRTWPLVLLFAASPSVMENTTYTWTKAGSAFYVVLALWFYLAGWRKSDRLRTTAAFIALAAGLLVHYSAGPYTVILAVHYLAFVFSKRRRKWSELAGIALSCGLLLGTWICWSIPVYGARETFASNTSVTSSQQYEGNALEKVAGNLYDTLVPAVAREPSLLRMPGQPSLAGRLRDMAFVFYQLNAIFGMGLVGGPLVLLLLYRAFRGNLSRTSRERQLWLALIPGSVLLGVAAVGERDHFGSAHLALLPLKVLGLSMLAAVVPWRRFFFNLILVGCVMDFSLGVLLQAHVESLENTATTTVFPPIVLADGAIRIAPRGPDSLSATAWENRFAKRRLALLLQTLRDFDARETRDPAVQKAVSQVSAEIARAREDDSENWQGWFARHEGEVQFLGDHVAGDSGVVSHAATALLLVLFVGLACAVGRTSRGGIVLLCRNFKTPRSTTRAHPP